MHSIATLMKSDAIRSSMSPSRADAARWRAVLGRSRAHDGAFVYAVTTTGIYCRPSCPSRRPARDNVRFFAAPDDAERHGFRACRRCTPRTLGADPARARLEAALRFLEAQADERPTLAAIAQAAGLSPSHLQRAFTREFGVSPREWLAQRRLETLKGRLKSGESVGLATYEAGFGSSRGVYALAARRLGMPPGRYARGGAGQQIRYAIERSPLGALLVAATSRGVCDVIPGDRIESLIAELRAEFPHATLTREKSGRVSRWARTLARRLREGELPRLPLDLAGTPFQLAVWRALRDIPFGETRTYGEIAAKLGRPHAARAVASACAANRAAVVVPCHRVTPATGGTGGYRWGRERKRSLLALERRRG